MRKHFAVSLVILLGVLFCSGCGGREAKLAEVERYHEEMDEPDREVLLLTEQIRRWADGITEVEPDKLPAQTSDLIREAHSYQQKVYEFGDFFDAARFETEEIREFQGVKVELLARLQEYIQSFIDDFLRVYSYSAEDEEALIGSNYHEEWIRLSCSNFIEAVEGIEGEFTRGRRLLLSQFLLMGDR